MKQILCDSSKKSFLKSTDETFHKYLTPEHHGDALPEALSGLLPPVGHHPLEGGVL
jgi:hypothetical protein